MSIKRRSFLKLSAATVGALGVGVGLAPQAKAARAWYDQEVKTVFSYCENCFWRCGIKAFVAGGRVFKVEGYAENPKSRGKLCPRGQGAPAQTYDPDRLKKPLIRIEGSQRGEGRYREATWEEALDYIAQKMLGLKEKYGPESVAFLATVLAIAGL